MSKKIDWIIVIIYVSITFIGIISIYSNNYNINNITNLSNNYIKQFIWIIIGILISILILLLDPKIFSISAPIVYIIGISLLLLVLITSNSVNGSKSWIDFTFFKLQPSEISKLSTSLFLANILAKNRYNIKNKYIWAIYFLIIIIPFILIVLQKDTGTAITFFSFIIVLYREGLSIIYPIIGLIMILCLFIVILINSVYNFLIYFIIINTILLYFLNKNKFFLKIIILGMIITFFSLLTSNYIVYNILKPYQISRITVLFSNKINLKKEAYNLNQAKIAIGSGRLLGKGFLKGTQTKYNFIPQQDTDFIFCTIAEQWGFIGSLFILILYYHLIIRVLYLVENQNSIFIRVLGYSYSSMIFSHVIINIGMTLGLIPVIGIPLPYISYGGSSFISFTIFLFIILRLTSYRVCIN